MNTSSAKLVLLAALALAGCSEITGPDDGLRERRFRPPDVYACWWSELKETATTPGRSPVNLSIDDVRWYEVLGGPWEDARYSSGGPLYGSWSPEGPRIRIAEGWLRDEGIVKHEMLHHYLGGDAEHDHPLFRYLYAGAPLPPGRCGS